MEESLLKWVAVSGGALAIGHRPKSKSLAALGATHIVTLLSEREGAHDIAQAAERAGVEWLWFPLKSGNPAEADERATRALLRTLRHALLSGGKIFIHCSAGIHRTGMITTALLRSLGLNREESSSLLRELRDVTAAGVGHARVEWASKFAD